jgi:bacterial leucyl aminopeptidase
MSIRHLLVSLTFVSGTAFAAQHIVIAPDCLLKQTPSGYKVMAHANSMNLLAADDNNIEDLITAKNMRQSLCGGFVDVTPDWEDYLVTQNHPDAAKFLRAQTTTKLSVRKDYKIQYAKEVESLMAQVNPQQMWDNLREFTSFQDRYADSDNGVKAANWLKNKVMGYANDHLRQDISFFFVDTGIYKQPSLVIKIGNGTEPGIVVGAHMDTLSGSYSKKPGADDDGSGSMTVLEATRTIINSGVHFKKPLYIMWYAAEEEGLVGSNYVVKDFQKKNIAIDSVIHFDLTGYAWRNESTMYLITDHVNPDLTNYLGDLIKTYVKQPIKRTACGYGCSDHATWTRYGYAAAIPAESAYENTNPNIHSTYDTMDKLSLDHMTDYTKLAVAFAVELAEPIS